MCLDTPILFNHARPCLRPMVNGWIILYGLSNHGNFQHPHPDSDPAAQPAFSLRGLVATTRAGMSLISQLGRIGETISVQGARSWLLVLSIALTGPSSTTAGISRGID
jgi:hypothetical protein